MASTDILGRISRIGIVPVVRAASGAEAIAVVEAIRDGGIDVIELTMTVPGAVDVIRELVKDCGDQIVVGAGTILDPETARACVLAGARFVVSPIVDVPTITCCRTYDVPVLPGALTPTEVVRAWQAGASMVKVFPCGAVGGASYVKALRAPLPQIPLVPTGGVSLDNVADFIRAGAAAVGAGADLADVKKVRAGAAAEVTERARRYVRDIEQARAGMGRT